MQETELRILYDTQDHEVKLSTFLISLEGFNTSMQEISKAFAPNEDVELSVKAIRQGSLEVAIGVIATQAAPMLIPFFKEAITLGDAMLSILVNIIELKKHTKGEMPASVYHNNDQVYIENMNGNVIVMNQPVFNFASDNTKADKALTEVFKAVSKDGSIDQFTLAQDSEPLVKVDKEEYGFMAKPSPIQYLDKQTLQKDNVLLQVTKANFDEEGRWSFIYEGNRISAEIQDQRFYDAIDGGLLRFTKGDHLRVDLEILQVLDRKAGGFVNKGYVIISVLEHIPRQEHPKLFDPKDLDDPEF